MSSVDERIVRMTFDNKQFEQGVNTTLGSLDKLNKGLKLEGATKGLSDVSAAADKISLGHIGNAVDEIAGKFKTLGIIGVTALTNIVNKAVDAGTNLIKSLTITPIMSGYREYETNLNSIQTILANTGLEGEAGLKRVTDALTELNHYSDQTIYNFSEMARNIGTFTAAGVDLDTATGAIKGIANLAAVSGSSSEQASAAMYQLSQAMAAGKVAAIDWISVVNASMGGKVFQDSLMETARVHGVAIDKMVKDAGGFKNSLEKGWLTSGVLSETLQKFTGDLNAQQLKSMGYNDKQIEGILKMGKTAQDAATKVKTMTQLINTLQEAVGSGWAQTWQTLFGDFNEAKELFTDVNDVISGFVNASSDARNQVLSDWKALGGRKVIIDAIANAFHALVAVVKPIRDAFREIFPPITAKQLMAMSVALRDFTAKLKIGEETSKNLKRTFAGLFAVLDIIRMVFVEAAKTVFEFVGSLSKGSGGVLKFTGGIGDFLVGIRDAIKSGNLVAKVFDKIGAVLQVPVALVKALASKFKELFSGIDVSGNGAAKKVSEFVGKLEPLAHLGDTVAGAWKKVVSVLGDVWDFFAPMAKKFASIFGDLGSGIADALQNLNYDNILKGIQTGLFAGLLLLIKQFIGNITGGGLVGGGILDSVKESIDGLTDTLGAMQNTLRAAVLLEIAIAIGILAVSMSILSKIDGKALVQASIALVQMFTMLLMSMAVLSQITSSTGFAKIPLLTAAMIPLAIAIDLLTIAVRSLAKLDWNGLAKGLTGTIALLGAMVGVVRLMPPSSGLISTGLGLIVLSAAVKLLASSVKDLSKLGWAEMAKGLTGVAALLAALALFTMFAKANATGVLSGAGIVLLAAGIKILASALKDFAQFSWKEIGKGMASLAGALTLIGAALYLIPPTAPLSAAGVLIVATSLGMIGDAIERLGKMRGKEIAKGIIAIGGALTFIAAALAVLPPTALLSAAAIFIVASSLGMISDALMDMSKMSWTEIGKSMVMLAGSLGIIATALYFMTSALPGAAALLVVAASLRVLAPVLQLFGDMSWGEIGKGLLMLAAVFAVFAAAGYLLGPVTPVLLALGAAIVMFGVGALLAGAGVFLFATALTALALSGAAGTAAIVGIVSGLIGLLPVVVEQIGKAIVAFADAIAAAGPAILNAITVVIMALIDAIMKLAPKVVEALLKLLKMMLDKMNQYVPDMVRAGFELLIGILEGIRDNIYRVQRTVMEIIAEFLDGVSDGLPRIIDSGVRLIIAFVNGMAEAIRGNSRAMQDAGSNLGSAVIEGMIRGMAGGIGGVIRAARNVAESALNAAMRALGVNSPSKEFMKIGAWSSEGMAIGLDKKSDMVAKSSANVGMTALSAMKQSLSNMSSLLDDDMDLSPTITPVLDLTEVQKNAGQIGNFLQTKPISVDTSYSAARSASSAFTATQSALADQQQSVSSEVTFVQNNTSPKALSAGDIYRNTKNQLSMARGVLA